MAVCSSAPVLNFCVPEHEQLCIQGKKEAAKTREFSLRKSRKTALDEFSYFHFLIWRASCTNFCLVCVNAAEAVVTH